jgi:translation elongation factor EF-G
MTRTIPRTDDSLRVVLSTYLTPSTIAFAHHGSLGEGDKQGLVGRVPLKKILGYSTKLRSLTAGSGVFTAEYFAHQRVQE